jgi:hypothetical protein
VAACGLVLANNWADGTPIICIEQLGEAFLETVSNGDKVEISEDVSVKVYH